MEIRIDKQLKTPIYMQIVQGIKREILIGALTEDSILPSERALAKMLNVHRNTVNKAYTELKGEGVIDSEQGVGYRVAQKEVVTKSPRKGKKVNWMDQINDKYLDLPITFDDLFQRFNRKEKISLGSGIATPGMYDIEELSHKIAKIVAGEGKNQYFYSPHQGDESLRRQLVSFLSTKGIKASPGQIQILTETNQALDFLINMLVKPGDVVVTEEPVSPDTYRTVELAGAKLATVPMDEYGIQCDYLEEVVKQKNPKLICLNSSFHDPTGSMLSLERRKKVMEISETYRIPIIEYDEASELYYGEDAFQPIKAFDRYDNVVYIYSFSLTFVPGLSLAFIVANGELIHKLSYLVSMRLVAMDWLTQKLISAYLEEGIYYRKLNDFRQENREKRDLVCNELEELKQYGLEFTKPQGGIYLWCKLPRPLDSKNFIIKAYANGISLLPGHVFYPTKGGGRDYIRINYTYEDKERLLEGVKILKDIIIEELK